jgi:hypothetical protein
MSAPPKDRKPSPPEWPIKPSPAAPPAASGAAKGKVVHDDRGNAKWDLGLDTSSVKKLTTSQLIETLDVADLSLLDEEPAGPAATQPQPGGGFDPYGTGGSAKGAATRPVPPGKPRR